jgi:hypothetical protein
MLQMSLKAVVVVHTPLARKPEATVAERLLDVAKKLHIMQALQNARDKRV